jgi:hypothetical protein
LPTNRTRTAVVLVLAVFLLAACGEAEEFDSPSASGDESPAQATEVIPTSTREPEPSPTPLYEWDAFTQQAQMYADQIGVSLEEAKDRLSRQDDFGPLYGALETNEQETFAGAYLQHQPDFKFVVLFTRDGEETNRKYVKEASELDKFIEVRHVRYSQIELQAIRDEADDVLAQIPNVNASSSTSDMDNRVEYYVQNAAQVEQMLVDAGLALPEGAVMLGDGPPVSFDPPAEVPDIYIAIPKPTLGESVYPDALLTGTLVLEGGCLLVDSDHGEDYLLPIWHHDHRLQVDGERIEVVNRDREVIARVGDPVWIGGAGGGGFYQGINESLHYPIPESCPANGYWGVGWVDPLAKQPVIPTPVREGAPFDLHTVEWPVDFANVESIIDALPQQLAEGLPQWEEPETLGRMVIGYGPNDAAGTPRLVVTDLTTGTYFPDYWTAGDLMASLFMGAGGRAVGGDGNMTWASEDTSHSNRIDRYDMVPVHAINWGTSDGRVLFTASSADYAQLEILVAAVIATMN